jgi:GT2 family glycosyltransferase
VTEGAVPTVVIVSYRRPDKLQACLDSLIRHHPDWPVKVLDNYSEQSDAIRELSTSYPSVDWTFLSQNVGFSRAVNILSDGVATDLLLLNPDAIVGAPLAPMVSALRSSARIGAVGPWTAEFGSRPWDVAHRPINPIRAVVTASGYAGRLRWSPLSDLYRRSPKGEVGYLTGSCLLIRSEAWADVGAFDEQFFLYSEEVDWALRARRRGWELRVHPATLVAHAAGGTVSDSPASAQLSRRFLVESQEKYLHKHFGRWGLWFYRGSLSVMNVVQSSKRGRDRT